MTDKPKPFWEQVMDTVPARFGAAMERASHGAEPAKAAEPRSLGAIKRWAWSDDGMTEMADGAFVWFSDYTMLGRASPSKAEGEDELIAEIDRWMDHGVGYGNSSWSHQLIPRCRARIDELVRERDEAVRDVARLNFLDKSKSWVLSRPARKGPWIRSAIDAAKAAEE